MRYLQATIGVLAGGITVVLVQYLLEFDYTQIAPVLLSGGVILAFIQHFLDKSREREAEWRKEKLKFYINFVQSLSGITDIKAEENPNNHIAWARSCNNLYLFAPKEVMKALQELQEQIKVTQKNRSVDEQTKKINRLFKEIRKDIGIENNDLGDVDILLWTLNVTVSEKNLTS
ncbi:MAG: hypothetical protein V1936_02920 [Patescibacteria group bacterium]